MGHSSRARRSPNKALIDRVPKTLDDLAREIVKIGEKASKLFGEVMIEISDKDIGDIKVPEIVSRVSSEAKLLY